MWNVEVEFCVWMTKGSNPPDRMPIYEWLALAPPAEGEVEDGVNERLDPRSRCLGSLANLSASSGQCHTSFDAPILSDH